MNELDTLRAVSHGSSLARFGDGELKCCYGRGYRDQKPDPELAWELREILRNPAKGLVVGIPTLDPEGPKIEYWRRYAPRFLVLLDGRVQYGSAFIGRDDHAPWVYQTPYQRVAEKVWRGRRVAVVCSAHNKTLRVRKAASFMVHVECPKEQAFSEIRRLEAACLAASVDVVLLSCGVTATVLAGRLTARGRQAVDVGSMAARLMAEPGDVEEE
jgi:hypothetical protein